MRKNFVKYTLMGLMMLLMATWVSSTPLNNYATKKQSSQIIFLDETNVEGERPIPMSTFSADHLAKSIRPFSINKNVRPVLRHYETRSELQNQARLFYDMRNKTQNW